MQSFGRAVTSKALIQLFYLIRSLHVLRSMFCNVLLKQSRDQNQLLIYFSLIKKKDYHYPIHTLKTTVKLI